jgi:hypothetical protein
MPEVKQSAIASETFNSGDSHELFSCRTKAEQPILIKNIVSMSLMIHKLMFRPKDMTLTFDLD